MGFDDAHDDDEPGFRPPLPPDDRIWRHPSEVAGEAAGEARAAGVAAVDRGRPAPRLWPVALVSGLVGALLAVSAVMAGGGFDNEPKVQQVVEREAPAASTIGVGGVAAITERVGPAIVHLVAQRATGETVGSGVLFRDDGHILTSDAIVGGAAGVTAVLSTGIKLPARFVGGDPDTDLAVVKIDGPRFPTATLGSATALRTGESCITIGAPLGPSGGPSVSVGVVSALGRTLDGESGVRLYDMIQTDAVVAPPAAGGALLNRSGAVIGITTAMRAGQTDGLAFATPIEIARSIADELMATGKATHAWLGIEGADLTQADADRMQLTGGVTVRRAVPDSPAADAGLLPGDVIIAVDEEAVHTMAGLVVSLRAKRVHDTVALGYLRDGKAATVTLTLQERPSRAA